MFLSRLAALAKLSDPDNNAKRTLCGAATVPRWLSSSLCAVMCRALPSCSVSLARQGLRQRCEARGVHEDDDCFEAALR